ncbi:hypothetical protein HSB1_47320 [Halogranum salarium B-1]|uniref:Uncharacterized protein n=1 Tax=Halogranum salarium B-1 TaxID=1210908 RepID=J2Z8H5_9EURY|nr:hypothetical protein HSB1_47320 [Halogranum salarium B-1]
MFIGFKPEPDGDLHFCSCAKDAIRNFIRCKVENPTHSHRTPTPENILTRKFPKDARNQVQEAGIDSPDEDKIVDALKFANQLCHRCNGIIPEYRYCHEMYGTVFMQKHGWYVNQQQYEYGVCGGNDYLYDVLPEDLADILDEDFRDHLDRYEQLRDKKWAREREIREQKEQALDELRDELAEDIDREERYRRFREARKPYEEMDPLPDDETEELEELQEQLQAQRKGIMDTVENEVRKAFGHYKKGNRWTSETILYQLVESNYPDHTIKRHYRPAFLDGLELDIYLVEAEVGIEYQGIQHYEPVDHWGGEEGLEKRQERDEKKKRLCKEHGIELVCIRHDQELTDALIERTIDPLIEE